MTAHELAKLLLKCSDKQVIITTPMGGGYILEGIPSLPWEDLMGNIRIQFTELKGEEKTL